MWAHNLGEVSIPEALTIGEATDALKQLGAAELEMAIEKSKSEELCSLRGEAEAICDGIVLLCDDEISFIMPPGFLRNIMDRNYVTLPPVAVQTGKLVTLLNACRGQLQK